MSNTVLAIQAPANVMTQDGNSVVGLSWSAPPNVQGNIVYTIWRGTSSNNETALATTTATSYSDTSVVNGTTYYYKVSASDSAGASAVSSEVATVPPYGLASTSWIGGAAETLTGFQTSSESFIAGSGDGMFYHPSGIAIDQTNGYFYIADTSNNRIEKFNLSTGAFVGAIGAVNGLSTGTCPSSGVTSGWCTGGVFASGNEDGAFSSPSNIAIDTSDDSLFVFTDYHISKFILSTGVFVGSIGDLSASSGTCPSSGPASTWCTGGTFTSGTGDGEFSNVGELAVDSTNGFLFVADPMDDKISRLDINSGGFFGAIGDLSASTGTCPSSGAASGWCTGGTFTAAESDGTFDNPWSIAADPTDGYLYVGDKVKISRISINSGAFKDAIGTLSASTGTCPASGEASGWCTGGTFTNGEFSIIGGLAINPSGGFLYAQSLDSIIQISLSSGAYVGAVGDLTSSTGTCPGSGPSPSWCTGGSFTSTGTVYGFYNLGGIAIDTNSGSLYIPAGYSNKLDKISASTGAFQAAMGAVETVANGWSSTTSSFVSGVADGKDGEFNTYQDSAGVAIDSTKGYMYASDSYSVEKFSLSTGKFVGAIGYLSSSTGSCPSGGVSSGWCTGGVFTGSNQDGGFETVVSISLDAANNALYVLDDYSGVYSRVEKFNLSTGAFIGAIGNSIGSTGTCPSSVGFTPIWCTGGEFTGGGYFTAAYDLAVDTTTGYLYVVDEYSVSKFNSSTGSYIGSIGDLSASSGTCPASGPASTWCTGGSFTGANVDGGFVYADAISLDPTDDFFYIVDYSGDRIDKFTLSTGAFIGSIGALTASSGTCPATGVASDWCTGGTFASGTSDGSFSNPAYLAVNVKTNRLYISDAGNNRLVMVDSGTGAFLGAMGDTSASAGTCPSGGVAETWCTGGTFLSSGAVGGFNSPFTLALDPAGDIYIYDYGNNRVVRLDIQ